MPSNIPTKEQSAKNSPTTYGNFLGTASWTKDELDSYAEKVVAQMGKDNSEDKPTIKEVIASLIASTGSLSDRFNITSNQMEGIYNIGYQAFNQGNYKQAIGLFRLLFLLNPLEPKYIFSLGLSLEKSKKFFEAATAYMMNYFLDENNPIPYFCTGICFLELGENEVAFGMFQKTMEHCTGKEEYKAIAERAKLFSTGLKQGK